MKQMKVEQLFADGRYMVVYLYPHTLNEDELGYFLWNKEGKLFDERPWWVIQRFEILIFLNLETTLVKESVEEKKHRCQTLRLTGKMQKCLQELKLRQRKTRGKICSLKSLKNVETLNEAPVYDWRSSKRFVFPFQIQCPSPTVAIATKIAKIWAIQPCSSGGVLS